jgi:hypothetical protein
MKRACLDSITNFIGQNHASFVRSSNMYSGRTNGTKSSSSISLENQVIKSHLNLSELLNSPLKKVLISLILIFLAFSNNIFGQKYAKNQFVVFSYTVDVDDRVKKELSPFENLINYKLQKGQSAIEAMIVNSFYQIFTKTLEDSLMIYFLAPESMGDKATYTVYGYPDVVIQKAIRLSDVKYFMKIELSVENSKYDERGNKLKGDVFLPVVNVSVSIYNKFGFNPIQSAEGQAVASSPIQVKESFLAGLNFVSPSIKAKPEEETLKVLFERCTLNALYSIKYKKIK